MCQARRLNLFGERHDRLDLQVFGLLRDELSRKVDELQVRSDASDTSNEQGLREPGRLGIAIGSARRTRRRAEDSNGDADPK